jgi:ADP-ribose pyrophosphatase
MHLYLARDLEKKARQADDDEYIQLEAVPLEEAIRKIYDGEIKDAKTISGLLLAYNILKGAV